MKEQLMLMLELQQYDQELQQLEKKLAQQEKAKEIFKQKKHKDRIEETIKELMDNLKVLEKKISLLDINLEQLTLKTNELNEKLYDNNDQDTKKLVTIQEKLRELKRIIEAKEEQYYTLLEEKETLTVELSKQKEDNQELKAILKKMIPIYKQEKDQLLVERDRLAANRNNMVSLIDKDLLKSYNQKQGDKLIVEVVDGNCGNCRVKLNFDLIKLLKKQDAMEKCDYCGKILFLK